ncbi:MAG: metallophosphoesterase [Bacteroidia bacterium]|nr:metallophosphoesterase [Bacteroidia bacterium]
MHEFKIKLALIIIASIVFIDFYSWFGFKQLIRKYSERTIAIAKGIWWGIGCVFILFVILSNTVLAVETNEFVRVYFSAIVIIVYLSKLFILLFVFADDIRRGVLWIYKKISTSNTPTTAPKASNEKLISRSDFLAQAGTLTAAVPFIVLSKGIFKGAYDYQIHRVPLYIKNLPSAFEGIKIAQLSDIHTGSLLNEDAVYRGVKMLKAENPDMIFFTGDIVNIETTEAYTYADMFRGITAPMGVFSIYGNHDYGDYTEWESVAAKQKNLSDLANLYKDMGWHLLRNENVTIDKQGQRIGLIGVENWGDRGRFQKYGDIDKAKQNMPDVPVKLLLSHDPSHFDKIISKKHTDIDVTFSGHTHGMQFGVEFGNIKWSPAKYMYPHWAGLYEVNGTRLYVNRGFGFLGYPGRIGILPEITIFELKKFEKLS